MIIKLNSQEFELPKAESIKIPTVLNDKVIISPGNWNKKDYSKEEIKWAFDNTNWSDKNVISLIADHADEPLSIRDWLGYVINQRFDESTGCILGDLELYDEDTLIKLTKANAKFGVSARLRGTLDSGVMKNFTFENFSVVANPACKEAYINLSEDKKETLSETKAEDIQGSPNNVSANQPIKEIKKCPNCGGDMIEKDGKFTCPKCDEELACKKKKLEELSNSTELKGGNKNLTEIKTEDKSVVLNSEQILSQIADLVSKLPKQTEESEVAKLSKEVKALSEKVSELLSQKEAKETTQKLSEEPRSMTTEKLADKGFSLKSNVFTKGDAEAVRFLVK